jgi:hypothetical protein
MYILRKIFKNPLTGDSVSNSFLVKHYSLRLKVLHNVFNFSSNMFRFATHLLSSAHKVFAWRKVEDRASCSRKSLNPISL